MGVLADVTLRGPADWHRLVEIVREHAGPMAERGTPMRLVIAEKLAARSLEAHRFMWGGVLDQIASQVCLNGRWFAAESYHQFLKELHLPDICARGIPKWQFHADGSRSLLMSTTDLDRQEFDTYLLAIQAHAAAEWGVIFYDYET